MVTSPALSAATKHAASTMRDERRAAGTTLAMIFMSRTKPRRHEAGLWSA